ncbi:MAG: hypothetical protein KUG77_18870 [Nannocystaceae bacterium]|nr:hypothetical protein [Nannocystaceae bacterium]
MTVPTRSTSPTDLIQDWTGAPSSNLGVILVPTDSETQGAEFGSRESDDPPVLVVTYAL